ncbi:MAG: hypothetical protein WDM87_06050 [Terracidiphilus sp.]
MSIFSRAAGLKRTAGVVLLAAAMTAVVFARQGWAQQSSARGGAPQAGGAKPAGTQASGAQRGFQPENPDEPAAKNGHQYIVAIGIDHYENWPILSTAVSDATGFAKLLTTKFGFEYAVEPLTEKAATGESDHFAA